MRVNAVTEKLNLKTICLNVGLLSVGMASFFQLL